MKRSIVITLVACALALGGTARAEQSGAGHYISGMFSDFSTTLPSAEGWSFLNFALCYDNARAGGERGLPFGGRIAANIKVQQYAEIPAVLYAPPFQILGGQPSVGAALPYVWLCRSEPWAISQPAWAIARPAGPTGPAASATWYCSRAILAGPMATSNTASRR